MNDREQQDSRKSLDELFDHGGIRVHRGALFDQDPARKPPGFDFDRVEAMLLGIAIGDSLGAPTESMLPHRRRAQYGELRDYIPNRHVNEARGFPTDDTQLSFWTLEQMIADGGFYPANVARRIASGDRIFGLGSTVREFLRRYKAGTSWYESGPESAGNGALMRIAPMLIPHLQQGGTAIWADTALSAMMTHNDYASNAACLAFVAMLWELMDMDRVPDARWWAERYVELTRDLEGNTSYAPRGGIYRNFKGPVWGFVEMHVMQAYENQLSVAAACDGWYSGAYLLETLPSVLYILMQHAHEPEKALVRAVNDTKDNDTVAAIVGAAVGALHGRKAFPDRWVNQLSGRTSTDDDGRIFELIEMARTRFWEKAPAS